MDISQFRILSQVPQERWDYWHIRGWRPGVKIVLYDRHGYVLLCRSTKGRLGFVGGGIDEGETFSFAALREAHEEAAGHCLNLLQMQHARLLAWGLIPTKRDGYHYKATLVVAAEVADLAAVQSRQSEDGSSEFELAGAYAWRDVFRAIEDCPHTKPEARDLFCAALTALAIRQGWEKA